MVEHTVKREEGIVKALPSDSGRIELLRAMLPQGWGNEEAMILGWVKTQEEITFLALTGGPEELRAKGWSGTDTRKWGENMLDLLFDDAARAQPGLKALQHLALRFFDSGLPIPERLREFIRASILDELPTSKRKRPTSEMLHFQNATLDKLFREAMNLGAPSQAQAYRDVSAATGVAIHTNDPGVAIQRRLQRFRKQTARRGT